MAKSDKSRLHGMWEFLPPEIEKALADAIDRLAEEVQRSPASSVPRCPRCGSANTTDCKGVKSISDPTVGLCTSCGYLWCLECDTHLIATVTCGHWKVCSNCPERKDQSGYCHSNPWECEHIKNWIEKTHARA